MEADDKREGREAEAGLKSLEHTILVFVFVGNK